MVRVVSKSLVFFFLVITAGVVSAGSIKVTLDRDVISLNDSFTIFFQAVGSVGDPDFSPLGKDFSILSKQKRSNLSLYNGKSTSSNEWLVEVKAKRDGVLEVPSIKFGKELSPTVQITVKNTPNSSANSSANNQGDDEIFIEVEAVPEHSWVQSQIIYTIRLFRSVNTFNSSLSEPKISGGKMIAEKLEDRQFETSRNNKRYIVLQRRYALFPQASGEFTFEPIVFTGQVSQRSRHLFDPFGRNSQEIQRLSRQIHLNIKPVPVDYSGKTWLPAKKVQIEEKWVTDPNKLVAGEPVTRTVVIKADGLSSEQLPEISLGELDDFKIYPDQAEMHNQTGRDGVLGIRQEKSAMIPNKAGEFLLPAVELKWWNTQTGEMEIAELPERVINVLPGTGKLLPDQTEESLSDELISEPAKIKVPTADQSKNVWPWVSLFLALGWLSTILFWWKQRHKKENLKNKPDIVLSERRSLRALREVIRKGEPVEIKNALLVWGKSIWKENPPISLSEIGERGGHELAVELDLLNQNLYGKVDQQWDGERLLLAVENFDGVKQQQDELINPSLPPLNNIYP